MKKIIFCDVDGTIIDGSRNLLKVSEKTKYAFKELKKDNYIFISTGRALSIVNDDLFDLNPSGFVSANGAYCFLGNEIIFSKTFTNEQLAKIREVTNKYNGFYLFEENNVIHTENKENNIYQSFMKFWPFVRGDIDESITYKDVYMVMIGFENDEDLFKAMKELEDVADCAKHNASISCDVNVKGINKGVGVKEIIKYLNIDYEDTYAFGDGLNDIEMLEAVKHAVVMENGNPLLKKMGFEKADDVLDDGFYNYLVRNKIIKEI